jgi:hypothetical protein
LTKAYQHFSPFKVASSAIALPKLSKVSHFW